jgi:N4-gp56 family major capsid protein
MADYGETLNVYNSGSNFIPKLWSDYILYTNPPKFIYDQLSVKAVEANAYAVQFEVVGTLATAGTNVGDGTITGTSALTVTTLTLSPQTYGNAITWSDTVQDWSVVDLESNVMMNALRTDYQRVMDLEAQAVLAASTDAYTLVGGTWNGLGGLGTLQLGSVGTFDANGALIPKNIAKAVSYLNGFNAKPFADGYYVCAVHPNQAYTLKQDSAWVSTKQYADPAKLLNGEVGEILGARVIETTQITKTQRKTAAGTGTSYAALLISGEALGKGFDKPLWMSFYNDDKNDGGRFKKLQWNSRGRYIKLKADSVIRIETTSEI